MFRRIQHSADEQLRKIHYESIVGRNDMLCPFGLEQQIISNEYTKKRVYTKILVTSAVLKTQARSLASGEDDDKMIAAIANASMKRSEWSRERAQSIGTFQAILARQEE